MSTRFGVARLAVAAAAFALLLVNCRRSPPPVAAEPELGIEVLDASGQPLASRVHLRDEHDRVVNPPNWPAFNDHFVFPGRAKLRLAPGRYAYEIERGPEFSRAAGSFEVSPPGAGQAPLRVRLERIADLRAHGFYAGDLHVHRDPETRELLMRAEDLHVAAFVTWGNDGPTTRGKLRGPIVFDGARFAETSAGEDERLGGALLYFRLDAPLPLPPLVREDGRIVHREGDEREESPPPSELAEIARARPRAHIDIEKPFWWDVPTWLTLGFADSLGIANNHMTRIGHRNHEAWGRPCDRTRYGDSVLANGYCSQDIYYHVLNAGFRLAPSAGSASGVLPNPVGYNRVYVHVEGKLTPDAWWQGLKSGRSFVTNGPLLLVTANGQKPGSVLRAPARATLGVTLDARVLCNEPIRVVELIRDGKVAGTGKYDAASGSAVFEPQAFAASGWFLVRAFADRADTFRFASTAPFYVEIGEGVRRISRASVRYFADWTDERIARLRKAGQGSGTIESVIATHVRAKQSWEDLLRRANAE